MMRNQRFNGLSWSTTRITVLEYCQKKYFFNYYTQALKEKDEKLRLETLLLKNLKSLEMRVGEKTHWLLSDYIKLLKEGPVEADALDLLKDKIAHEMREEFEASKTRDYTLGYDKERRFGLSEHYYGEDVDAQLEPVIEKVMHNLDVFIESEWNDKVQYYMKKAKTVFIESPREKNFEGMKVDLRSIPSLRDIVVMASPDFGIVFDDKHYLIIDRKSGHERLESEGVSDQIKIYALKLLLKTRANPEDIEIEGYEIYLPSLKQIGGKIGPDDIESIKQKLVEDIDYQKQFLVDGDAWRNQPLASTNFERTKSEKKCVSCTFRKVCGDLKDLEY